MKKYFSCIKFGLLLRTLILGACFFTFSYRAVSADTISTNQESESGDVLLQKQVEIDKYVFGTHMKELENKGITVTHTGPQIDYVEIGITPFNDESAKYLYGIFGKDIVKVVEGQQAVTLSNGGGPGNSANSVAPSNQSDSLDKNNSSSMPFLSYIIVGMVFLGVIIIMTRKLRGRNG